MKLSKSQWEFIGKQAGWDNQTPSFIKKDFGKDWPELLKELSDDAKKEYGNITDVEATHHAIGVLAVRYKTALDYCQELIRKIETRSVQ